MKPVGVLLAAGRGRRFDSSGGQDKLLQVLPGGEAVVVASARAMLAVLPRVLAVVRGEDGAVARALSALGCELVVCPEADDGMAASLVRGVRHSLPQGRAWVIALGDMPHVAPATIAALCGALDGGAAIALPVRGGRRGNPVAFGRAHQEALLALHGDCGARSIVQANPVVEVEVVDYGIFRDIDTPADLNG
jgi:molybdenum cofactor cytidylyltransferase